MSLNPARQPGESFADYKARRAAGNREVAARLRPRMLHVSTEPVILPVIGADPAADAAVIAGRFKDLRPVTLPGGKEVRVGRTKGTTYYRPQP